jgi:hypothetical protein
MQSGDDEGAIRARIGQEAAHEAAVVGFAECVFFVE